MVECMLNSVSVMIEVFDFMLLVSVVMVLLFSRLFMVFVILLIGELLMMICGFM